MARRMKLGLKSILVLGTVSMRVWRDADLMIINLLKSLIGSGKGEKYVEVKTQNG